MKKGKKGGWGDVPILLGHECGLRSGEKWRRSVAEVRTGHALILGVKGGAIQKGKKVQGTQDEVMLGASGRSIHKSSLASKIE